MIRRRSGQNFQEIHGIKDYPGLSKQQVSQLMNLFKKTETKAGSGITLYDLCRVIQSLGLPMSEQKKNQINSELQNKEIKTIDLNILLLYVSSFKKEKEDMRYDLQDAQNNEFIDAFVALGGNTDTSGCVSKQTLINILKNEFELSIDLQGLLNGMSAENSDDHLYFGQFKQLFEQEVEQTNRGSVLSILSKRSMAEDQMGQNMKTLVVDHNEFQRYLAKLQGSQN